jgi:hypothetical protein
MQRHATAGTGGNAVLTTIVTQETAGTPTANKLATAGTSEKYETMFRIFLDANRIGMAATAEVIV